MAIITVLNVEISCPCRKGSQSQGHYKPGKAGCWMDGLTLPGLPYLSLFSAGIIL